MKYFKLKQERLPTFVPVPHFLWKEPYSKLSSEAKLLYGLLLARTALSQRNNWIDNRGYAFVVYTLAQICDSIGCAEQKAVRLIKELSSAGLIERQSQGIGRPCKIFVKLKSPTNDLNRQRQ